MNSKTMSPQIIAFYLPQFYPFKENDEWWGKGFTEWTNVGRAKPLFRGHYQPRVPADLGYYDLRIPEVREQQVELARKAGVTAFCYWHYWFGNGRRLLERVFDEVLESGKPDFPFCLGWANHSWYAKTWDKTTRNDKLLMEQIYPGEEDARAHFQFLLKAFSDKRYLKIDGMPFLYVFDPYRLPQQYIDLFRTWTKEAGFKDLFLVANWDPLNCTQESILIKGYQAVVPNRLSCLRDYEYKKMSALKKYSLKIIRRAEELMSGIPRRALNYEKHYHSLIDVEYDKAVDVIPSLIPQWDHSPRSGHKAQAIFYNSRPEFFKGHAIEALKAIKDKPEERQILLIKSWNEWAEGNYMEPDLRYGHGYIKALREAINESNHI